MQVLHKGLQCLKIISVGETKLEADETDENQNSSNKSKILILRSA